MTYRQRAELADGREIFYYDEQPGADRSAPDLRVDLTPMVISSEVRWNPLFRDYAVIAGHRQVRTYLPPPDLCPLCPSSEVSQTEIPASEYEVAVFENRFPSLALQSALHVPFVDTPPFLSGPGDGRCEVVSFTSDHLGSFAQLSPAHARTVIDAWADRTEALSSYDSIDYVFCFENRGAEIGVTLTHPHGQIYGYPFVPPRFFRVAESLRRYRDRARACLQCVLVEAELKAGERIVAESEYWVTYVPFAARWPYEVRIVPRRHLPDIPSLDGAERDGLASAYLDVLRRFDSLFGTATPYIAGWQQAPVRESRKDWHLAAEVFTVQRAMGKIKFLAGSESGAATWINDVSPEVAAARLRGETSL